MKKLLALLLALCMLSSVMAVFSGCEETGKKKKSSTSRKDDDDDDDNDNEDNTDPEDDTDITDPEDDGDVTEYPVPPEINYGHEVGQYCPSTALNVANGADVETIDPSATGKITILNFWMYNSELCTNQLDNFETLMENYDVQVIAVHAFFDEEYMESYIENYHADSDIVFTYDNGSNGSFYVTMGNVGFYPYSLVLDENGKIVEIHEGAQSYQQLEDSVVKAGAELREGGKTSGITVQDNYFCLQESEYIYSEAVHCCHIPAVYYQDVYLETVNTAMYEELISYISEWGPQNMIYEWGVSGDVMSIVVQRRLVENDHISYNIYNISLSQDKFLTQEEFCEALGTSRSAVIDQLTTILEYYNSTLQVTEYIDQSTVDWMKENNLSQENLDNSIAFIDCFGQINYKTCHYVPAGSGITNVLYAHFYSYSLTEEPHLNCGQ